MTSSLSYTVQFEIGIFPQDPPKVACGICGLQGLRRRFGKRIICNMQRVAGGESLVHG